MPEMPLFKGPEELRGVDFWSLAALSKTAATSLNKDEAARAHKVGYPVNPNLAI